VVYKVLIVDDSSFFQARLKQLVNEHPDLNVVGCASNGQEAIDMDEKLRPDIISMDYEMPYLDGVSAVRVILSKRKVPIVMFSSMTYEGAKITLEALEAGAVDFVPKNFSEVSRNSIHLKNKLHNKLLTFAKQARPSTLPQGTPSDIEAPKQIHTKPERIHHAGAVQKERVIDKAQSVKSSPRSKDLGVDNVDIIIVGASTGGPVAVADLVCRLPANFPVPIVIIQHMPENFTKAFSERLNKQAAVSVKEAESRDTIRRGQVLVAPGGKQLIFDRNGSTIKIIPGDDRVNYKPCIDVTYASAANVFGSKVLAIVMTGMGADGCEGARLLKSKGACIWGQDQETSVVYGMPAAVAKAKLVDEVLPLKEFAPRLISKF